MDLILVDYPPDSRAWSLHDFYHENIMTHNLPGEKSGILPGPGVTVNFQT